jgi:hypothetical protein
VSVTAAPPPPAGSAGAGVPAGPGPAAGETCPLCGAPLDPEQEWCLRCGAAARTRLAASSNWKAPIIAFAVLALLSLGVLAASLVKLAGGGSSGTTVTSTVIRAPTAAVPTTTTPPASTPLPGTGATGTGATGTGATGSTTTPPAGASTPPGASSPGAGTTLPPATAQYLHKLEKLERKSSSPAEKRKLLELEARVRSRK